MLSKFFFEKKKTRNWARKLINFVQPKMLILSSLPPILVISFIYMRHQNFPSLFNIGGLVQDLLFHVFQVIHGLNFFLHVSRQSINGSLQIPLVVFEDVFLVVFSDIVS